VTRIAVVAAMDRLARVITGLPLVSVLRSRCEMHIRGGFPSSEDSGSRSPMAERPGGARLNHRRSISCTPRAAWESRGSRAPSRAPGIRLTLTIQPR
jgi:hypothetical protein